MLSYLWGNKNNTVEVDTENITVGIAESVSAGAVSTTLCSEPGASHFVKGATVAYSIQSKKDLLGVDIEYAEKNNFANPFTTEEMARAAARIYKARLGISTTGYSLPMFRKADESNGLCEFDIKNPYAYICLYDSVTDQATTQKLEFKNDTTVSPKMLRATVQAKIALACRKLYYHHVKIIQAKAALNKPSTPELVDIPDVTEEEVVDIEKDNLSDAKSNLL